LEHRFSVRERIGSFRFALRGIAIMMRSQHNAWIHCAASIAVVAMGFFLELGAGDWAWLILAMSMVWIAEAFNTALERLADAAVPEFHPGIGAAKDAAAAAVLLAAIGSAIIGLLVLGPPLLARLGWAG
jgi:diacylglycerol kinase (ATP)